MEEPYFLFPSPAQLVSDGNHLFPIASHIFRNSRLPFTLPHHFSQTQEPSPSLHTTPSPLTVSENLAFPSHFSITSHRLRTLAFRSHFISPVKVDPPLHNASPVTAFQRPGKGREDLLRRRWYIFFSHLCHSLC